MMDRLHVGAVVGLTGAAAVSLAARRVRALSSSGALAATAVGATVVVGRGIRGGGMLLAFFCSSTLLGRLPASVHLEQRRGRERDAVQVMANGGVAAALALASSLPREPTRSLLIAGFGGAVATATADTWATEIGSRSRTRPRSILTLRPTARGASGSVTMAGLTASAVAATLIAWIASVPFTTTARHPSPRAFAIAGGGFTGALVDSVLGATVQEVRFCDTCFVETEERLHHCGAQTRVIRGAEWCGNDTVNAIATAAGATTAILAQLPSSIRGQWARRAPVPARQGDVRVERVEYIGRATNWPGTKWGRLTSGWVHACPRFSPDPCERASSLGGFEMTLFLFRMLVLGLLLAWLSPHAILAQESTGSPTPEAPPPAEVSQPAYEVLRVDDNGTGRSYRVWEEWVPQVVTTPDGGAWAFFTAQIRSQEGNTDRRLFASRFDPGLRVWLPAHALGSNATQFGATAAVDSQGVVHLIYSSRAGDGSEAWSQLVYQRFLDGAWTDPVPVGPHPDAGHQMLASLAIDDRDGLHVVWRDQRFVTPEARAALATNADLLTSDLVEGEWTEPAMINVREAPDINPAWPHLVADGDRLVVVWSIYRGTTAEEMRSAVRVDWSSRPLDASSGWSAPQTLYVREGGDAGGRLIDLASDPRGGAVVIYGLFERGNNDLMMQRLDGGKDAWTEPVLIARGDYGYLPVVSIAGDGTIYTVFNNGRNRDVDIGGLIADPSGKSLGAVSLTPAEGGITARASIALDHDGTPWVVYMHQPEGSANVTEIRAVRAATFTPPAPS